MIETPFFFREGGSALFGVWHEPAASPSQAFVFCHPFAEEKLWAQRVFVTFARRLAARGSAVLRFDLSGNGDSAGDFETTSLDGARADIANAIEEVRRRTGLDRVHLLGLRFGATLASLVAEERSDVERLVLWAPIVDGGRYMQELLRINLTTQMAAFKEIREDREALAASMASGRTVNIDGYELAHQLFTQASAVKLATSKRHAGPCLVVHVDRQPTRVPAELQKLAAGYSNATLLGAEEEPFWKEIPRFYQEAPNLFAATLEWLAASGSATHPSPPAVALQQ